MATIDVERFIEIQDESNHYDIALQEINGGPEKLTLDMVHLSSDKRLGA